MLHEIVNAMIGAFISDFKWISLALGRGFDFLGYRIFPEGLAGGPKIVEHFVTRARHIQIMHNRDKQTSVAPATVKLK